MNPKEYVEQIAKLVSARQAEMYGRFLAECAEFISADLARSEQVAKQYRGEAKQCFYNCAMVVLIHESGFDYCEGFATHSQTGVPVEHAWLVCRETGDVVDPTWEDEGAQFFGVRIPAGFLRRKILETETTGPFMWEFLDSKRKEESYV